MYGPTIGTFENSLFYYLFFYLAIFLLHRFLGFTHMFNNFPLTLELVIYATIST
jgi:hypothetical protein